jgi:hypothetical protein
MGKTQEVEIGKRYGRLVVIEEVFPRQINSHGRAVRFIVCKCDCGVVKQRRFNDMKLGKVVSCGCTKRNKMKLKMTTHGMSGARPWRIWINLTQRIDNPNSTSYRYYGGRGVTIPKAWRKFEGFWGDMEEGYKDSLSLDRIDNDGHYSKENCRWTTSKVQNRNSRHNIILTYGGRSMCVTEWSEETGISAPTIYGRISRGWPHEKALTISPSEYRSNS